MPDDKASITLEGFLGEHRRWWKLTGQDLETWEDGTLLRVECLGCGAAVIVPLSEHCS